MRDSDANSAVPQGTRPSEVLPAPPPGLTETATFREIAIMADRALSTSRRALLAAPLVLPALHASAATAGPPGAAPAVHTGPAAAPGALAAHAARIGALIRESNHVDSAITVQGVRGDLQHPLCLRWSAITDDIVRAVPAALDVAPRTIGDVVVQLVLALDQVHEAENDTEALDPLERVAEVLRRAILLLAPVSGTDLRDMQAGYFDHELRVALDGSAPA
jgi:hypothetical protein